MNLVTISEQILTCVNAGNSRTLLIQESESGFISKALSVDHTPENEKEKKRVEDWGGEV